MISRIINDILAVYEPFICQFDTKITFLELITKINLALEDDLNQKYVPKSSTKNMNAETHYS